MQSIVLAYSAYLVSAENGSNLEVKSGSVIITQKLAKLLDLKTGDTITIKLSGHEEKEFKIGFSPYTLSKSSGVM